jgi:predicted dienelactone hydrolase
MAANKMVLARIGISALAIGLITANLATSEGRSENSLRERIRSRMSEMQKTRDNVEKFKIAGLDCAVWAPANTQHGSPLVIFSHGFHGSNMQSAYLMEAMAKAGYLVVAPNHHDASATSGWLSKPETSFSKASQWSDQTYADRKKDITTLLSSLRQDEGWNRRIDWGKVALAGHSLGGYTVLGLSGAWPSWKLPEVKAVLALSPYCWPYSLNGNLGGLGVPVMYQGGTDDRGITPFVKGPNGAFAKSSSPAYFVNFDNFNHYSWTNLNHNEDQRSLVDHYSIAFLDKYVKNNSKARPELKEPGVVSLEVK